MIISQLIPPDSAAVKILSFSIRLIGDIKSSLVRSSSVILQHSVFGLLKNLSIPQSNKTALGDSAVIEAICAMEPWDETKDLVGSLQGAALGTVKNLCRNHGQYFHEDKPKLICPS
jgi:hypothetical protein